MARQGSDGARAGGDDQVVSGEWSQYYSLNISPVRPEPVEGLRMRGGWFDRLTTNG